MLQTINYCSAAYELALGLPLYFAPDYFFGVNGVLPYFKAIEEESSTTTMYPPTECYLREVGCLMITFGLGQLFFFRRQQVDRNVLVAAMSHLIAHLASLPILYMAVQDEENFVKTPLLIDIAIKVFLGGLTAFAISQSCQDVAKQPITTPPSKALFWVLLFAGLYGVYFGGRLYINGALEEFMAPAVKENKFDPGMMFAARIEGAWCFPSALNVYAAFRTSGVRTNRLNCLFAVLFFVLHFKNMYNTTLFAKDVERAFVAIHVLFSFAAFYAAGAFDVIGDEDQVKPSTTKKSVPVKKLSKQTNELGKDGEPKIKSQ